MLNALLIPTEGVVLVDGMDTRDTNLLWQVRCRVGMVFQNPDNQIVGTVVEEDVAFGPENLGFPPAEIRQRVNMALQKVGMSLYAQHPPHLLSGGQKQRVAIAGVLAMQPRCVVLDEPTSLLDPKGRVEVCRIIRELNSEGMTIILITHRMEEAMMADRVLVLENGRRTFLGTPAELLQAEELLRHAHLDLPLPVRLQQSLRECGIQLPRFIPDPGQLIEALCALKRQE
jgi:energy-coupling factor transport system ATP-binding protein